jgi:hypothetical protein
LDKDGTIQITDFVMLLRESDDVGGFAGEAWSPMPDISRFARILSEIVSSNPVHQPACENGSDTLISDVPEFVSEIIEDWVSPESDKKRSAIDLLRIAAEQLPNSTQS